jgi:DNA-binding MarR family transcriptional regulator
MLFKILCINYLRYVENRTESKFIEVINFLNHSTRTLELTGSERDILFRIYLIHLTKRNFLVGDIVEQKDLGSVSTLHYKLKLLRIKGYLKYKNHSKDERKKQVFLSKKSIDYFEQLKSLI